MRIVINILEEKENINGKKLPTKHNKYKTLGDYKQTSLIALNIPDKH